MYNKELKYQIIAIIKINLQYKIANINKKI